ncbi:alpha/beta-hydrolase [Aulographum hederae CBS 113979]|uniref:Alpha/beta-hydrolase n=1 Tax=Aulographum hederae CBS 113979 TaxID=1176131 RepID=A0A6G1HG42_9PEZI|nr:alpha/beta-hydrolase [Aulographum hederae CBS 113979]
MSAPWGFVRPKGTGSAGYVTITSPYKDCLRGKHHRSSANLRVSGQRTRFCSSTSQSPATFSKTLSTSLRRAGHCETACLIQYNLQTNAQPRLKIAFRAFRRTCGSVYIARTSFNKYTPASPRHRNLITIATSKEALPWSSTLISSPASSNHRHAYATMATSASDSESSGRGQQSPLASRREGQQKGVSNKPGFFPLGYKDGFTQWWASPSPAVTEHRVLSYIPFLQQPPTQTDTGTCTKSGSAPPSTTTSSTELGRVPSHTSSNVLTPSLTDPYGPRRWASTLVPLDGKDRALNEFSVERIGEDVDNNLVMLHGYGAGLGFFYKNYEALSRLPNWRLYSLDLLGMGRSTRPPFKIHAKDRQGKTTEAENWFIDALEEWRIKRGINKFTLLGHSLGGYMAVCYALKYPGRVNKLVLASPVGIPEDPYAMSADMPEPEDSTMINEFTQDGDETTRPHVPSKDGNNFLNKRDQNAAAAQPGQPARRPIPKWLTYLWDANVSPFSVVRWSGPLGPRFVSGWTSRRFSHLPPDEAQALHNYSYSLFRQRGSGEYALAYVLAPGAFARSPLIRRIQGVGRQWLEAHSGPIPDAPNNNGESAAADATLASISTDPSSVKRRLREAGVPVVLMYGENDWMDVAGGYAAEAKINEAKQKALKEATQEEKKNDKGGAKVVIIQNAGHHLYLEGADQFNDVLAKEMRGVEKGA